MVSQEKIDRFINAFTGLTKIFANIESYHKDQNLTKYELFALEVSYKEKELTMSQIAKNLGVSMSTATGIVDKIVEQDLAKRERNSGDRRVVKVKLTEKGKKIALDLNKQSQNWAKMLLSLLTPEEQDSIILILEKVSKIINGGKSK
ncbi:MAG: MarR family winged helix-turn-helix transcriptional regulator [Candidatus Hodarchaeota archaeon]